MSNNEQSFICEICNHDAKTKGNLITHLKKQAHCGTQDSNIDREEYIKKLTDKPITENTITCQLCTKLIHKAGLSRHNKKCKGKRNNKQNDSEKMIVDKLQATINEHRILIDYLLEELQMIKNSPVKLAINIISDGKKKYKKKKITHTVKISCWNTHVGELIPKIKCLCCNNVDITQHNFHCGHIVAECNGGTYEMNNLLPICNVCNNSMGTMNMNEFRADHGFVKK